MLWIWLGFDFAITFLDDILFVNLSIEERISHLTRLLKRLQEFGLIVGQAATVEFLGYMVDAYSNSTFPEKMKWRVSFLVPCPLDQVSRYLGLLNSNLRFLPEITKVRLPPMALLAGTNQRIFKHQTTISRHCSIRTSMSPSISLIRTWCLKQRYGCRSSPDGRRYHQASRFRHINLSLTQTHHATFSR